MSLGEVFKNLSDQDKRRYMKHRAAIRRAILNAHRDMVGEEWTEKDDLVVDRIDVYMEELSQRAGSARPTVAISAPTSFRSSALEAVDKAVNS